MLEIKDEDKSIDSTIIGEIFECIDNNILHILNTIRNTLRKKG